MIERSAQEGHRRFIESTCDRILTCEENPCPHFAIEQWLAEPIEKWGRGELCDLLAPFVAPDIDERLYEAMTVSGDVHMAFEDSVDWKRFAELTTVRRRTQPTSWIAAETPAKPIP